MDDGADDDDGDRVVEVEVWWCHENAVDVFRACQLTSVGAGMGGVLWTGIAAEEIRAALALRRAPRAEWPDIADEVRYMADVVCGDRNKKASDEAKRRNRK